MKNLRNPYFDRLSAAVFTASCLAGIGSAQSINLDASQDRTQGRVAQMLLTKVPLPLPATGKRALSQVSTVYDVTIDVDTFGEDELGVMGELTMERVAKESKLKLTWKRSKPSPKTVEALVSTLPKVTNSDPPFTNASTGFVMAIATILGSLKAPPNQSVGQAYTFSQVESKSGVTSSSSLSATIKSLAVANGKTFATAELSGKIKAESNGMGGVIYLSGEAIIDLATNEVVRAKGSLSSQEMFLNVNFSFAEPKSSSRTALSGQSQGTGLTLSDASSSHSAGQVQPSDRGGNGKGLLEWGPFLPTLQGLIGQHRDQVVKRLGRPSSAGKDGQNVLCWIYKMEAVADRASSAFSGFTLWIDQDRVRAIDLGIQGDTTFQSLAKLVGSQVTSTNVETTAGRLIANDPTRYPCGYRLKFGGEPVVTFYSKGERASAILNQDFTRDFDQASGTTFLRVVYYQSVRFQNLNVERIRLGPETQWPQFSNQTWRSVKDVWSLAGAQPPRREKHSVQSRAQ